MTTQKTQSEHLVYVHITLSQAFRKGSQFGITLVYNTALQAKRCWQFVKDTQKVGSLVFRSRSLEQRGVTHIIVTATAHAQTADAKQCSATTPNPSKEQNHVY